MDSPSHVARRTKSVRPSTAVTSTGSPRAIGSSGSALCARPSAPRTYTRPARPGGTRAGPERLAGLGPRRAPQRARDVPLAGRLEGNAEGADRSQELRVAARG